MTIIYECDGCGKTSKRFKEINSVMIDLKSAQGQGPREYHLCSGCERDLRERANPTTWVRHSPQQEERG